MIRIIIFELVIYFYSYFPIKTKNRLDKNWKCRFRNRFPDWNLPLSKWNLFSNGVFQDFGSWERRLVLVFDKLPNFFNDFRRCRFYHPKKQKVQECRSEFLRRNVKRMLTFHETRINLNRTWTWMKYVVGSFIRYCCLSKHGADILLFKTSIRTTFGES